MTRQALTGATPAARRGRLRQAVVLATLAGAGLVLLSATATWARVDVTEVSAVGQVTATGREAAPLVVAVALAAAAGGLVLGTAGRAVRLVVAAGLVAGGVLAAVAAAGVAADPAVALVPALTEATGVRGGGDLRGGAAESTGWPWLAVAGCALLALAGIVALATTRHWKPPGGRFEIPDQVGDTATATGTTPAPSSSREPPATATWDALSRGEDPT